MPEFSLYYWRIKIRSAALYEVPTKALNQAMRRNLGRFPEDFAFQLPREELDQWRSQIVTSNPAARMGLRRPPFAFTQEGVAMLASVLRILVRCRPASPLSARSFTPAS